MKHTPAPWRKADGRQVQRADGSIIATAWYFGNKGCVSKDEAEANNCLIAAAPDMYEALRWLLHLCSGVSKGGHEVAVTNEEWTAAWESATMAVQKAKGE